MRSLIKKTNCLITIGIAKLIILRYYHFLHKNILAEKQFFGLYVQLLSTLLYDILYLKSALTNFPKHHFLWVFPLTFPISNNFRVSDEKSPLLCINCTNVLWPGILRTSECSLYHDFFRESSIPKLLHILYRKFLNANDDLP